LKNSYNQKILKCSWNFLEFFKYLIYSYKKRNHSKRHKWVTKIPQNANHIFRQNSNDLLKILVLYAFCCILTSQTVLFSKVLKNNILSQYHQINNEWSMTVPQINGTFGVYFVIKYLILLLNIAINSMWCASWRFLLAVDFYRLWIVRF
jgi:hypothetical protein